MRYVISLVILMAFSPVAIIAQKKANNTYSSIELAKKKCLASKKGVFILNDNLSHEGACVWDNRLLQCRSNEVWQKKLDSGKWVRITHNEFSKLCKCEFYFDEKGRTRQLWDDKIAP